MNDVYCSFAQLNSWISVYIESCYVDGWLKAFHSGDVPPTKLVCKRKGTIQNANTQCLTSIKKSCVGMWGILQKQFE